jgi:hypothetical protein
MIMASLRGSRACGVLAVPAGVGSKHVSMAAIHADFGVEN